MNCIRTAAPRGFDDAMDVEIAVARSRRSDLDGTIGGFHMQRIGVRRRIDRDSRDAHAPRGADDAAGDLAAIGDQQSVEHRHILNTPKRVGGMGAFNAADSARPSTRRVSAGSMMPSSHNRAVA